MPAILTHDFFGQDAFGEALEAVSLSTPDLRDAFLLGNQGPDPLFYLVILPPLSEFEHLGHTMHVDPPSRTMASLAAATRAIDEDKRPVARAYLAGFVCHYLLDRAMHPLVYYWERSLCEAGVEGLDLTDASIVHAEVERDLDEMVLYTKRTQTIAAYKPYEEVLRVRDEVLEVIGELYFRSLVGELAEGEPTSALVFPLAVRCFRVLQTLFYTTSGTRMSLLASLERPLRGVRYSLVKAMSHRVRAETTSDFDNRSHEVWRDPFTGESRHESFWDLYDHALKEVVPAVSRVVADDFDEVAAYELTGGLNFGGERVE